MARRLEFLPSELYPRVDFIGTDRSRPTESPDASMPAVAVYLLAALIMLVITAQRRPWKPLSFKFH